MGGREASYDHQLIYYACLQIPLQDARVSTRGCLLAVEEMAKVLIQDAIHLLHCEPLAQCPLLAFLNLYPSFQEVCRVKEWRRGKIAIKV